MIDIQRTKFKRKSIVTSTCISEELPLNVIELCEPKQIKVPVLETACHWKLNKIMVVPLTVYWRTLS